MAPTCPRCGYDLIGVAKSWTDRCPLDGTCSECGLEYRWVDVMRPERHTLPGYFEHARWLAPLCFFRTLLWTLRPARFWQRVELHHRVIPRRLVLFVLLLIVPPYAAGIAAVSAAFVSFFRSMGRPLGFSEYSEILVFPIHSDWGGWFFNWWLPYQVAATALSFAFPVLLFALPATRSAIKVRAVHVLRAGAIGAAWAFPAVWVSTAVTALWAIDNPATNDLGNTLYDTLRAGRYPILALISAWQFWWWYCAMRWGMKFPEPNRHFAVLVIPALLIVALIVFGSSEFWYAINR